MTFLNQPAVKLDGKQSLPKRLSSTSPEKFVVSPQERPTKEIYHRKKKKKITAPVVTGRVQHKIQHPSPGASSPICTKKQEVESSRWTLSGCCMLSVLSEKPRGGGASDLCVVVCVSGRGVGRRRRVGFDPPALHV